MIVSSVAGVIMADDARRDFLARISSHDRFDREGRAMASRETIAVGQMQVGEEGYCRIEAIYVAPSSPRGPDESRDVAPTACFLLHDADVYSEPSPLAKLRVRRLEDGFAVRMPPGEVPSRYVRQPRPGSFPVVAME
jgi:hypothetical protein